MKLKLLFILPCLLLSSCGKDKNQEVQNSIDKTNNKIENKDDTIYENAIGNYSLKSFNGKDILGYDFEYLNISLNSDKTLNAVYKLVDKNMEEEFSATISYVHASSVSYCSPNDKTLSINLDNYIDLFPFDRGNEIFLNVAETENTITISSTGILDNPDTAKIIATFKMQK